MPGSDRASPVVQNVPAVILSEAKDLIAGGGRAEAIQAEKSLSVLTLPPFRHPSNSGSRPSRTLPTAPDGAGKRALPLAHPTHRLPPE